MRVLLIVLLFLLVGCEQQKAVITAEGDAAKAVLGTWFVPGQLYSLATVLGLIQRGKVQTRPCGVGIYR